jgi:hypothetical protein
MAGAALAGIASKWLQSPEDTTPAATPVTP